MPSRPSFETLVPRFGEFLIDKGLVSSAQIEAALNRQREIQQQQGENLPIGQILVDLGFLSLDDREQAAYDLLLQYRTALEEANERLEKRVRERTADLESAVSQLSALNELKTNLVANVSHELRTPLTQLLGYLQLLSDGSLGLLNEDQLDALQVISRSGQRLDKLIDDLIQFSTLEKDQIKLNLTAFPVRQILDNTVQKLQTSAKLQSIRLQVQVADALPAVYADAERLAWVLDQLTENAIKYSPDASTVTLSASREGALIRLEVADQGVGIPSDKLELIFEPFTQLDGGSSRFTGGTGLGLALVKRILKAHGAATHVESQPGKGSRFYFFLKAAE